MDASTNASCPRSFLDQVCPLRKKQLDQAHVSVSGSQHQRPVAKTIARLDRCTALDQKLRCVAMPKTTSMMKRGSAIVVGVVQGLAPVLKNFCNQPGFASCTGRAQQVVH